jgi:hypothetical protein
MYGSCCVWRGRPHYAFTLADTLEVRCLFGRCAVVSAVLPAGVRSYFLCNDYFCVYCDGSLVDQAEFGMACVFQAWPVSGAVSHWALLR